MNPNPRRPLKSDVECIHVSSIHGHDGLPDIGFGPRERLRMRFCLEKPLPAQSMRALSDLVDKIPFTIVTECNGEEEHGVVCFHIEGVHEIPPPFLNLNFGEFSDSNPDPEELKLLIVALSGFPVNSAFTICKQIGGVDLVGMDDVLGGGVGQMGDVLVDADVVAAMGLMGADVVSAVAQMDADVVAAMGQMGADVVAGMGQIGVDVVAGVGQIGADVVGGVSDGAADIARAVRLLENLNGGLTRIERELELSRRLAMFGGFWEGVKNASQAVMYITIGLAAFAFAKRTGPLVDFTVFGGEKKK